MVQFIRIDDRLFHGQVAVRWSNEVGTNTILIVDDIVADNPSMKSVYNSMSSPSGVAVAVCKTSEALELLRTAYSTRHIKVMVIVRGPQILHDLVSNGFEIMIPVNIGNMGGSPGKKMYSHCFNTSAEDDELFKEMLDKGVEFFIQDVPEAKKKDLRKVLKYKKS